MNARSFSDDRIYNSHARRRLWEGTNRARLGADPGRQSFARLTTPLVVLRSCGRQRFWPLMKLNVTVRGASRTT